MVYSVLDHIIPPTDETELCASLAAKAADLPFWKRLDVVVLQWIYATVSPDILTSILVVDDLAAYAWKRVHQIFLDNQNYRAASLETELTTTKRDEFSSIVAYYNRMKSIADQLANVGSPISDQCLVLRTLAERARDLESATALIVDDENASPPPSHHHGGNPNNHGRNSNNNYNNNRGRRNYNNRGKGNNNNNNHNRGCNSGRGSGQPNNHQPAVA
ncbi:uncharacterized protein [Spinacia oleracea]|uniref:Retrotransposon gag domain-containing protein n=1 Tax=Spinacia oleracea TaxID=3562 RepID=A0A9R0K337_SPIOL|nr:uncharacterized protein LOC110795977 [Spinacia oleracea]